MFFEKNLVSLKKEVMRSGEKFINSYFDSYDYPTLPPAWKTLEVLSFGQISKLYANFIDCEDKKAIAYYFNLPNHKVLSSWMRVITVLRNYCAHHSRVWNRTYSDIPNIPKKLRGNWINKPVEYNRKLYMALCCVRYMTNTVYPDNEITEDLIKLFNKYPTVKPKVMGFPEDWQEEPLWK